MRSLGNRVFVNFFNGIVLLLPITVTVVLIRFLVIKLNDAILSPLVKLFAPVAGENHVYLAKVIVFFSVMLAVAAIGWGAKILVINRTFSLGEKILLKVPIMGRIYNASKQIFSTMLRHGKTIFKQVVLLEYPRKGIYTLGFTTGITKGELKNATGSECINVFVPTTPNPTSGFFLVVPKDSIQFMKMSVEDGMKLIISGGSVLPSLSGSSRDDETPDTVE
ncbi:MAG: DUF502 domain-containing protein [Candidatus Tantalella remota]|nr:DUF502 domain-containing protein [Candidatus Tantalella remota]